VRLLYAVAFSKKLLWFEPSKVITILLCLEMDQVLGVVVSDISSKTKDLGLNLSFDK